MSLSEFDELWIEIDAIKVMIEYADCGSHRLKFKVSASRGDLKVLHTELGNTINKVKEQK